MSGGLHATDDIFVRAPRAQVARAILDLSDDASWWPGARIDGGYGWLRLDVPTGKAGGGRRIRFAVDVGEVSEWDGFGWTFTDGRLRGEVRFWFERFGDGAASGAGGAPVGEGTIVHVYLDASAVGGRRGAAVMRAWRWAMRRGLNGLKDRCEGRAPARTSAEAVEHAG